MKFNPTISFDGVAVIVACITCSVWFGGLSATVHQHSEQLKRHDEIMQSLSDNQKATSANIAVLTTLVNERTKNGNGVTH